MSKKLISCLLILSAAAALLLPSCSPSENPSDSQPGRGALTWTTWREYSDFLELAVRTYPDIELEFTGYTGANRTAYGWAQMQAGDLPDVFITSHILDEELAKESLVDLSAYDFVNDFSTALLDQVSIDGGIYLLPVSNAMYGIYYNKTLMEEQGWEVPATFAELESLCEAIQAEGMLPGIADARLTGGPFSAVFNLAKTSWLTTPEGVNWERDFLSGTATAAGMWEDTMDYVQRYIDIGMFHTDPEDRRVSTLIEEYLGGRKAMFCAASYTVSDTVIPGSSDELGMMPYISEDGSKNIYMYSPSSYIGISSRLAQPGNEKKLEEAIQLLSLLYSPEGQATFISEDTPCVLSVLDRVSLPEDALIYDAHRAMSEGRAFPMTYTHWDNILTDIGQAFKDWFQGAEGMDGPSCIARMDELQSGYLNNQEKVYFCESTADFTMEETARLVGKALGSAAGADAAMIPYLSGPAKNFRLEAGVTGKLYQGKINTNLCTTISPSLDGAYAVLTMTGAQARELAAAGFDAAGDGAPYPYVLVTRGGGELEDGETYQVAFLREGYSGEIGQAYHARVEEGSVQTFLRDWLTEQKTVSPDGNPWE